MGIFEVGLPKLNRYCKATNNSYQVYDVGLTNACNQRGDSHSKSTATRASN